MLLIAPVQATFFSAWPKRQGNFIIYGRSVHTQQQAVREVLMKRRQTISDIDVATLASTPGKISAPLTARRFEMSRILAEELLRMFIRRKRDAWEKDPASHPSQRGPSNRQPLKYDRKSIAVTSTWSGHRHRR